jgi:hypothetical protein
MVGDPERSTLPHGCESHPIRSAVVLFATFPQVAPLIGCPLAQRQRVRSASLIAAEVPVRTAASFAK